jgi:hypothetical protein
VVEATRTTPDHFTSKAKGIKYQIQTQKIQLKNTTKKQQQQKQRNLHPLKIMQL